MTAKEARNIEFLAYRTVIERINEGVGPMDSKVAVMKLVRDYGEAARRAEALETVEALQARVPAMRLDSDL